MRDLKPRKDRAKNRKDIGEVRIFVEDFMEARVIPSCVSFEATMEDSKGGSLINRLLKK